jgi:hypothetical protein
MPSPHTHDKRMPILVALKFIQLMELLQLGHKPQELGVEQSEVTAEDRGEVSQTLSPNLCSCLIPSVTDNWPIASTRISSFSGLR